MSWVEPAPESSSTRSLPSHQVFYRVINQRFGPWQTLKYRPFLPKMGPVFGSTARAHRGFQGLRTSKMVRFSVLSLVKALVIVAAVQVACASSSSPYWLMDVHGLRAASEHNAHIPPPQTEIAPITHSIIVHTDHCACSRCKAQHTKAE